MYESQDKMVSHPSHYQSESGLEVITVIEAFTTNLDGMEAYDTGNILKYMCRWKQKNGVQDLEKAAWYLQHLIDHVRNGMPTPDPMSDIKDVDGMYKEPYWTSVFKPQFKTEGDAKFFVETMLTLLKEYGRVSVFDEMELLGDGGRRPIDENYGWTELKEMGYYHDISLDKYVVVLPEPEKL